MSAPRTPDTGPQQGAAVMTPSQRTTFTELLGVGCVRPYAQPGIAEQLREQLQGGLGQAMRRWTEPTLFLSKAGLASALRCPAAFGHERMAPKSTGTRPVTLIGDLTHRGIQLAHTHPGIEPESYVRQALSALRGSDEGVALCWDDADIATQSDIVVQATSRVTTWLDSWPVLQPSWTPRFEEPVQAKVAGVTLAARVDLLLGRPRPDFRQTMLVADWKSGALREEHFDEAMFHALLVTLRHGVPPWRSTLYSLASGEFTDPDVTSERLRSAADRVIAGANDHINTLAEVGTPALRPGTHCRFCPLQLTCPVAEVDAYAIS